MDNQEYFESIRKPIPPAAKVFKSKKDYSRIKSIKEADDFYDDEVEVEFQKISRKMKISIDI